MSYRHRRFMVPRRSAIERAAVLALLLLTGKGSRADEACSSNGPVWPDLAQPVSSFGGTVVDGRLYVYSGHVGEAHAHSRKNLSTTFQRLTLDGDGGSGWEQLPAGPGLQGLPLAGWDGALYRDGKLYVVGGWNLGGGEERWHSSALVFDLAEPHGSWKELPRQPFERRALATVVHGGKLYAAGGMTPEGPSLEVDCLDLATGRWHQGPAIPAGDAKGKMNGFGCSACTVGSRLFLSTMDGAVQELSADGTAWREVGRLKIARFFHRLLPRNERELIAVAGASMKFGHLGSLETFVIPPTQP